MEPCRTKATTGSDLRLRDGFGTELFEILQCHPRLIVNVVYAGKPVVFLGRVTEFPVDVAVVTGSYQRLDIGRIGDSSFPESIVKVTGRDKFDLSVGRPGELAVAVGMNLEIVRFAGHTSNTSSPCSSSRTHCSVTRRVP